GRVRLKAAQDYALHSGIEVAHKRGRIRRGRRFRSRAHDLSEGVRLEGTLSGKDLVEHKSKRVDVALRGDFFSSELLRSHVRRSSISNLLVRNPLGEIGQTE